MKVSEFLKKVVHISRAGIQIEFKADKLDEKPDVESLNEYTPEESADQIIKRAAEYTLQEVVVVDNNVFITAVRAAKRTPKPKPEKVQDEKREEQKQAIAEELERLDQAVAVLIETIVAPFHRILTRVFGRGGGADV